MPGLFSFIPYLLTHKKKKQLSLISLTTQPKPEAQAKTE